MSEPITVAEAKLIARAEKAEAKITRVEALPPEMADRARAYHPKDMRRGAAAHQEIQEWRRAILAALEGGEEWEEVYKPRALKEEA